MFFYSTLCSSSIDIERYLSLDNNNQMSAAIIKEFYTIRVIIGLNSSQHNAEMLLDFKYFALGSLSKYSKLAELCKDKLKPPYQNHFSLWLVNNFFSFITKAITMRHSVILGHQYEPELLDDKIKYESKGGDVYLPSIWNITDFFYTNFELFLSNIHSYVHSPKEPNSLFHESIKCLKTILFFKKKYNDLTPEQRWGSSSQENIDKTHSAKYGYSGNFLYTATKDFMKKILLMVIIF
jgi:hypothetical protein